MIKEDNQNQNSIDLSGYLKRRVPEKIGDARSYYEEPKSSKMTDWVIRLSGGLIKNERQANYILLAMIAVVFIIVGIIFINSFSGKPIERQIPVKLKYLNY